MKKILPFIAAMIIIVSVSAVCYAGSVPEDLLNGDSAQVYFGEVKSVDGDCITVIQRKNIKGEYTQDTELTYARFAFIDSPEIGETYLCGYFNEINPLYMWDVTSLDTKTLTIKSTDSMSKRMQEYLNEGLFEEKEKERLTQPEESAVVILPAGETVAITAGGEKITITGDDRTDQTAATTETDNTTESDDTDKAVNTSDTENDNSIAKRKGYKKAL